MAKVVGLTMASLCTSGCGWGHRERLFAWEGVGGAGRRGEGEGERKWDRADRKGKECGEEKAWT